MAEFLTILCVDCIQFLQRLLERKIFGRLCDEKFRIDYKESGEIGLENLVIKTRFKFIGEPNNEAMDELDTSNIAILSVV
jgi:hypothetical protein